MQRTFSIIKPDAVRKGDSAAILSEGLHSHKAYRERERDRDALDACAASGGALTPVS